MKKLLIFLALICALNANDLSSYLDTLKLAAKTQNPNFTDFSSSQGEKIFKTLSVGKKGEKISCESCHGSDLQNSFKNYFTGKEIAPLSPTANPLRLTNSKDVEKWLKRNFNDVYNREGTAKEKGDVIYYIMSK